MVGGAPGAGPEPLSHLLGVTVDAGHVSPVVMLKDDTGVLCACTGCTPPFPPCHYPNPGGRVPPSSQQT